MPVTIKRQSQVINIEIDKGSTFRHSFFWKAGVVGGEVPVDLTGATARLLVKDILADGTVGTTILLDLTTENGGITLGTVTGEIELLITDNASINFAWSKGAYGFEVYLNNGDTRRLFRGLITAFDEIVR